ncbi:RecQ family ATP-dependent DNA helicase [Phragmitibacter flavus]|uniref:ATP-dependent DNA helicase RecQ n=2 Tax=Phragmitibacter flavus TaxID=2576071 RepID=A0A5R8K859_9BACT|nr:RecQ family ATP-dependent DNA helicase [Phragmitibacter flavus]
MNLRGALKEHFGHEGFRPGQERVVEALLAGKSALAVFPTGGGKSICYQLPALLMEGLTLVISPLIALMKDQVEALKARGIAAARLDSTLSAAEVQGVFADMRAGRLKLLYIAPERLMNESFMERLGQTKIALLAIDEAHCISEWGHNFRPEYLRLAAVARRLKLHPVLALTATATPAVATDIRKAFDIKEVDHVQTPFRRANLALLVTPSAVDKRLEVLTRRLKQSGKGRLFPAVVYVTLQQTAEQVATHLAKQGVNARAYHAGLPDEVRAEVQEAFMRGTVDVMVATIAFGMGIDKADVRAVFHYNLPKTLENYQQETGRAGRDGLPAHCEMLACLDDLGVLRNFVYGDTPTALALKQLVDHLLRKGSEFDISRYDLAHTVDIRPLVLETVLTYLELEGVLQPLGAFYNGYQVHFTHGEERVLSGHKPERQQFLKRLFDSGKRGYRWLTLDMTVAMEATGDGRERIMKALLWMEEAGDITLKPSGLRHRYRLCENAGQRDPAVICKRMQALFAAREVADAKRLEEVVGLASDPGCLTRHLLRHFGEVMEEDCGTCSSCVEGLTVPRQLPKSPEPLITTEHVQQIQAVMAEGHAALRAPRQLARFLCGLSSPATTRARLSRHDAFGLLEGYPFQVVLEQTESQ